MQWPLLLREGERVLADLREWTDLNTIELSNFFLDWGYLDLGEADEPAAPLALPPSADFSGLAVPVVDEAVFESVLGVIDLIRANGFAAACNVAPLYFGEAGSSSFACVDITGKPVPGLRSNLPVYGCPNKPEVRAYGEAMVRGFATHWPALDAISLNHLEYPFWPQAGLNELFVCWCDACRARAETEGLDFERMRREVASAYESLTSPRARVADARSASAAIDLVTLLVERPYLALWLDFRRSSMSEYARGLVAAGREAAGQSNQALQIGLEFQAPTLSLLVGTDFRALAPLLDWLTPKFPDYLAAAVVPTVAQAVTGAGDDPGALQARLRELFLLGRGPDSYEPVVGRNEGILYRNAFDLEMVELQLPYVADLSSQSPLYPYLWKYNGDSRSLAEKIRALRRHGYEGFFLWVWDEDLTTEALRDSVEALRTFRE